MISKRLFIIVFSFFFSSCSFFNYSMLGPYIKTAIVGVDDIDLSYLKNAQYSYARIRLGRSASSVFVLSEISDENVYVWLNSSKEEIHTFNGKIIKTINLINNFELLDYKKFGLVDNLTLNLDINLKNPDAYIQQKISLKKDYANSQNTNEVFWEYIQSEPLKWSFKNKYILDKNNNLVVSSEQRLHPNLPKAEIEFYYVF